MSYAKRAAPVLALAAVLIFWEAAVRLFQIPLYVLPSPTEVLNALISDRLTLFSHSVITVAEALLGMGISLVLAVVLGILMDAFAPLRQVVYPILVVTQTVPMIVLAPILIIYLGFGLAPKILTVVLMCFFPIAVSFTDGMAQLEPEYLHLARSFGASRWTAYRLVKIPAAVPSLISGLKVAATYSVSGAVVGEWIGAQKGLGYYLLRVKNGYMLDKVFACVLVIIFLSLCMNLALWLANRIASPSGRRQAQAGSRSSAS